MHAQSVQNFRGPFTKSLDTMIARLSLLTLTNPNQMGEVLLFYVLRWLMRPVLALNCLLQTEQERYEEESSVGNALALAFR